MATYFTFTFLDVAFATFLLDEVIIICSYSVFLGGMPNVDVFEYSASSMTVYMAFDRELSVGMWSPYISLCS